MVSETHKKILSGALGLSLLVTGLTGCRQNKANHQQGAEQSTATTQPEDGRVMLRRKIKELRDGTKDPAFPLLLRQPDDSRIKLQYEQKKGEFTLPCAIEYSWIVQDKTTHALCPQNMYHLCSMPSSDIDVYCSFEAAKALSAGVEFKTDNGKILIPFAPDSEYARAMIHGVFIAPELVAQLKITRENDDLILQGTQGGRVILHGLCSEKSLTQIIGLAAIDTRSQGLFVEPVIREEGTLKNVGDNTVVRFTDQSQLSARLLKQKLTEAARLISPDDSLTLEEQARLIKLHKYAGDFRVETLIDCSIDAAIVNTVFYDKVLKYKDQLNRSVLFEAVTQAQKTRENTPGAAR